MTISESGPTGGLYVATPMSGGMAHGIYVNSLLKLAVHCCQVGLPRWFDWTGNEALVQRARNEICARFLASEASHLIFIDADQGFDSSDVLAMYALARDGKHDGIFGTPIPKKMIVWDNIKAAVERGLIENVSELSKFGAEFVMNPLSQNEQIPIDEPALFRHVGTGFMLIPRHVLDRYREYVGDRWYRNDRGEMIYAYFDCAIAEINGVPTYLSEDWYFCENVRDAGMGVWCCPWMKIRHQGAHIFEGDITSLALLAQSREAVAA